MIKINLLATRDVKKKETMQQQVIVAILALIATLGIIAYFHVGIDKKINDTIEKKKEVNKEIASLEEEAKALKKLINKRNALRNRTIVIEELQSERYGPVMVMDELARMIPDEIWIDSFKLKNRNLVIKGYANGNEILSDFWIGLRASYYFSNVNLTQSKKTKKSGLVVNVFTLSMKVKYPKKEGAEKIVKKKPKKKPKKKKK